ncbi:hypothetical protein BDZ45DRAFT_740678 [Acephala macrosclerotiorum]|nr:hypothetical protein BDZ45DRAFT_740678 [Acephala macrosclerotiorum]
MGLVKAGIYIGAATYIIKKIKEDKAKDNAKNAPPQNSQYPPPGAYPQYQESTRGYPPQYQQYPPPPPQQQQFGYYDTHGPYEAQYQAPPQAPYGREERGTIEGRPYASQSSSRRESIEKRAIEDSPTPRQWPDAKPVQSSKW